MAGDAEAENQRLTIGVVVSCLVLSIASFSLRIIARYITKAKLWWDDYWMFWVMAICIVASVLDFLLLAFGSGSHQADLPEETVLLFTKTLYVYMLIWATGVFSVKVFHHPHFVGDGTTNLRLQVGILLFYWRVFPNKCFRVGAIAVGSLSAGIFLSNFFSFTFQCTPVEKFWIHDADGFCIDQNAFYLASAIINVIGDVAVLALPLPVVWQLHTSKSKKWSLSFLFLLGAFVCVASIFRIIAVTQIDPEDFTFTNVGGGLWSTVEVEVGFICANLPAIRPLLFKWFKVGDWVYGHGSSGENGGYHISRKGTSRAGHVKLSSKNQDPELQGSSTEELTGTDGGGAIVMTRTKSRRFTHEEDVMSARGLSDIVVKTDIGVSVDPRVPKSRAEDDRFIQVSTPHNQIKLPGTSRGY
ncbi:hypothetical protein F5Y15DRAFT_258122 [Xylariaceae sp. FL0016]|nr:hypothetical protein F5Y15DRAFT_258122 [Xylariaceae sp. FL0016]